MNKKQSKHQVETILIIHESKEEKNWKLNQRVKEIAFCQNCRITSSLFSIIRGIRFFLKKKKNNFMVAFYELGSTILSLQSNCEETVPFYH